MKELWKAYQADLAEKNITVPGTISKLLENHRFKIPTDTLTGTGDKNDRGEDSNTNKNGYCLKQ